MEVSVHTGWTGINYSHTDIDEGVIESGKVSIFDDGQIGIQFDDPDFDVLPIDVVKKMIEVWNGYLPHLSE